MSDPAIEAAQRAWDAFSPAPFPEELNAMPIATAREALKPIRDELDKLAKATEPPCDWDVWIDSYAQAIDRISGFCFSTEEMSK